MQLWTDNLQLPDHESGTHCLTYFAVLSSLLFTVYVACDYVRHLQHTFQGIFVICFIDPLIFSHSLVYYYVSHCYSTA